MMHAQTTVTLVSITLQTPAPVAVPRRVSHLSCGLSRRRLTTHVIKVNLSQLTDSDTSHNARPYARSVKLPSTTSRLPYSPPLRNRAQIPIFFARESCKLRIMGIGANKMAKSVNIQGIGAIQLSVSWFPHLYRISLSQFARIGKQMNAYTKVIEIHHAITIAPSMRVVI